MERKIQDVALLVNPPRHRWNISLKGGNMILNRFCIDEEMAFESSGVFIFGEKNPCSRKKDWDVVDFGPRGNGIISSPRVPIQLVYDPNSFFFFFTLTTYVQYYLYQSTIHDPS